MSRSAPVHPQVVRPGRVGAVTAGTPGATAPSGELPRGEPDRVLVLGGRSVAPTAVERPGGAG
ncbi:hypothetical protein [Pseudonocardia sp. NPDC049635]|uniref:hypothetical protein n=1 Tax=Pseudonocardia sp. NPDC049635 TaxID=3155506 RepID=UPI0033D98C73